MFRGGNSTLGFQIVFPLGFQIVFRLGFQIGFPLGFQIVFPLSFQIVFPKATERINGEGEALLVFLINSAAPLEAREIGIFLFLRKS